MGSHAASTIRERLNWASTPELHEKIRRLWIQHSIAEDKRDLDGLIATLTDDCVYELVPTGERWEGHEGARNFYTTFLTAYPDVHFDLQDIVIGPQGVFEAAIMTGTHKAPWSGIAPSNGPVKLSIVIHFPWDPIAQKFSGERVYYDTAAMAGKQVSST